MALMPALLISDTVLIPALPFSDMALMPALPFSDIVLMPAFTVRAELFTFCAIALSAIFSSTSWASPLTAMVVPAMVSLKESLSLRMLVRRESSSFSFRLRPIRTASVRPRSTAKMKYRTARMGQPIRSGTCRCTGRGLRLIAG